MVNSHGRHARVTSPERPEIIDADPESAQNFSAPKPHSSFDSGRGKPAEDGEADPKALEPPASEHSDHPLLAAYLERRDAAMECQWRLEEFESLNADWLKRKRLETPRKLAEIAYQKAYLELEKECSRADVVARKSWDACTSAGNQHPELDDGQTWFNFPFFDCDWPKCPRFFTDRAKLDKHRHSLHGRHELKQFTGACIEGRLDLVKKWRAEAPEQLDVGNSAGNKPLQVAAIFGKADIASYLIDQGCDIHCANRNGNTPLINAAANGHLAVVERLLAAGVDPLRGNDGGLTALDLVHDVTKDAAPIRAALRAVITRWKVPEAVQRVKDDNARVGNQYFRVDQFRGRRPNLKEILANTSEPPWTLGAFMSFLANNSCIETFEFTMEAQRYRKHYEKMVLRAGSSDSLPIKDREYVQTLWVRLVDTHIRPDAPREVNLPSDVRESILHLASDLPPAPENLDQAVSKIYELIEESFLVPFLRSAYEEYERLHSLQNMPEQAQPEVDLDLSVDLDVALAPFNIAKQAGPDSDATSKGILKAPRTQFPEFTDTEREGDAPLKDLDTTGIPPNARWTRLDRRVVSRRTLEEFKERFEERDDYFVVLRVLTKDEIAILAEYPARSQPKEKIVDIADAYSYTDAAETFDSERGLDQSGSEPIPDDPIAISEREEGNDPDLSDISFRTLDVLVYEDHPDSRLVMVNLLEKLRCRTIVVTNGPEAIRYAMSDVKFDIIMTEYKLPQVDGANVARMIRDTTNTNTHTPIVAVTGYLEELQLQAPHHFDALVEKPPTKVKLEQVLGQLCQWKTALDGWLATPAPNIHATLRASNLPASTTFQKRGALFGEFSAVKSISDDSEAGWFQAVLVEYENESTAKLAYSQLQGRIVEGIPLFVDWASEFSRTPKHGERERQREREVTLVEEAHPPRVQFEQCNGCNKSFRITDVQQLRSAGHPDGRLFCAHCSQELDDAMEQNNDVQDQSAGEISGERRLPPQVEDNLPVSAAYQKPHATEEIDPRLSGPPDRRERSRERGRDVVSRDRRRDSDVDLEPDPAGHTLRVSNLHATRMVFELRALFAKYGVIKSMSDAISTDSGRSVMVEYENGSDAREAFSELAGQELDGMPLHLTWTEREPDVLSGNEAHKMLDDDVYIPDDSDEGLVMSRRKSASKNDPGETHAMRKRSVLDLIATAKKSPRSAKGKAVLNAGVKPRSESLDARQPGSFGPAQRLPANASDESHTEERTNHPSSPLATIRVLNEPDSTLQDNRAFVPSIADGTLWPCGVADCEELFESEEEEKVHMATSHDDPAAEEEMLHRLKSAKINFLNDLGTGVRGASMPSGTSDDRYLDHGSTDPTSTRLPRQEDVTPTHQPPLSAEPREIDFTDYGTTFMGLEAEAQHKRTHPPPVWVNCPHYCPVSQYQSYCHTCPARGLDQDATTTGSMRIEDSNPPPILATSLPDSSAGSLAANLDNYGSKPDPKPAHRPPSPGSIAANEASLTTATAPTPMASISDRVPPSLRQLDEPGGYPCTVPGCSSTFRLPADLKQHFNSVHDLAAMYACIHDDDFWSFGLDNMLAHARSAHGDAPGKERMEVFSGFGISAALHDRSGRGGGFACGYEGCMHSALWLHTLEDLQEHQWVIHGHDRIRKRSAVAR